MPLILTMKSYHRLLPEQEEQKTLVEGALSIGRSPQSGWVILDPERVVSKSHCKIELRGNAYVLTDTSSNGVFLNNREEPVGNGSSVIVKDGDLIRLSDYEIEAKLVEGDQDSGGDIHARAKPLPETQSAAQWVSAPRTTVDRPPQTPTPQTPTPQAPTPQTPTPQTSRPAVAPAPSPTPASPSRPVQASGVQMPIPEDWDQPSSVSGGAQSGHVPSREDFIQAPSVFEQGPDDRHGEAAAAPQELVQMPETVDPAVAPRGPAPAAGEDARGTADALAAFLEGAALSDISMTEAERLELMRVLGAIFREVVQGLIEVLAARSGIKSEFRLTQTTLRPTENNPLKFSLGVDDAMLALLTKRGKGYLDPVDAVRESFDDIKAHQVAFLAGMQMALSGLLHRFNPDNLVQRIETDKGMRDILGSRKARYWDAFNLLYDSISLEAENDFHGLFGREFARAYQEQIASLRGNKDVRKGS